VDKRRRFAEIENVGIAVLAIIARITPKPFFRIVRLCSTGNRKIIRNDFPDRRENIVHRRLLSLVDR
jgi:hypothetical protein